MAAPGQSGIKVTNLREINKALKAVGAPNEEIKKAGKESGELVASEARGLVPVRSGALRNSIRVGATARGKITVSAGNNRTTKSGIPYANPIHWGWFKRNIKPQPFFVKALGYTRAEVYDNYFKQIEKLILTESAKTKL
jgi:hypothetical protein